jgi:hypothetical protein
MAFHNDCSHLDFYRQAFNGRVQDFIVTFNEEQKDIQQVLRLSSDLFKHLIQSFPNRNISARLVAKVNFLHVNNLTGEFENRVYHFSSYRTENVDNDIDDFFLRHMMKIASRLDTFNVNGSNLLIKNIEHLHFILTFT